jgi:hypothetical protein
MLKYVNLVLSVFIAFIVIRQVVVDENAIKMWNLWLLLLYSVYMMIYDIYDIKYINPRRKYPAD